MRPLMAIDKSPDTFWLSQPDGAAPKSIAVDMKDGTYRAYERGPDSAKNIHLDHTHAILFGKKFGVRWEWLLTGEGGPSLTPDEPSEGDEERQPNKIRAWREHRGLTREDLAKRIRTTATIIEQLETGEISVSEKWRRSLAKALETTEGWLLDHEPDDSQLRLWEAVNDVPKEHREQVVQILKTFKGTPVR